MQMNVMKLQSKRKAQSGIGLVEIMVALVLSLLLIAGVIRIYMGSKLNYQMQESLSRVQENARFVLETMAHDIRMAGYSGCPNLSNIAVHNLLPGAAETTESPFSAETAISGENDATAGVVAGTDTINILRASEVSAGLVGNYDPNNANIQVDSNPSNLEQDDIAVITDCTSADIFSITNEPGTSSPVTMAHSIGTNTNNRLSKIYGPGAQLMSYQDLSYFVAPNGDGVPALFRSVNGGAAVELAAGVENMQILYGLDTDGDRMVESYADASGVADWTRVVSVRVAMLFRSENRADADQATYDLNGVAVTPPDDQRMRKAFSMTVAVRNRAL